MKKQKPPTFSHEILLQDLHPWGFLNTPITECAQSVQEMPLLTSASFTEAESWPAASLPATTTAVWLTGRPHENMSQQNLTLLSRIYFKAGGGRATFQYYERFLSACRPTKMSNSFIQTSSKSAESAETHATHHLTFPGGGCFWCPYPLFGKTRRTVELHWLKLQLSSKTL